MLQRFNDKKTYSGTITEGAKKRISRTVDLLLQLSPKRKVYNPVIKRYHNHTLSFITLTIPTTDKNYTAKEAYKLCLAPFIRHFRDKGLMTTYIWKAELQERGQIHYHITTPAFIEWSLIRNTWNNICNKSGLMESYKREYGHDDPNSTDIHAVYKLRDIQAYLTKYLCKSTQNQTATTGKLWDCSLNIKGEKLFKTPLTDMHTRIIKVAKREGVLKEVNCDQCTILKTKDQSHKDLLTPVEKKAYDEFMTRIASKKDEETVSKKKKSVKSIDTQSLHDFIDQLKEQRENEHPKT